VKKNYFRPIFWQMLFLFLPILASAKHIVGGDFSYKFVSFDPVKNTNRFHFTMNVYRDAKFGTTGAPLDPTAPIGIYEEGNFNTPIRTIQVSLMNDGLIPVVSPSPCLSVPPDIQVEHGTYEFDLDLPVVTHSYFILYQRCCRNVTITNIVNPADAGATFEVEITKEAQALKNNGPEFKLFPPVAICANVPLFFDHSAVDLDGDVLKYKFCAPQNGGGPILTDPGLSGCDGAAPMPPCKNTPNPIVFLAPFSETNPMGGSPMITINPNTGIISGKPTLLGQFVVGVCVEEYRNGVLISTLRRDFQFNVVDCDPKVLADIKEDSLSGLNTYKVISCGKSTLLIVNQSVQRPNITDWYWRFDLKGVIDSLPGVGSSDTNWDALVTFPDTGNYKGILVLNPGTICGDTAEVVIKIRPDIVAKFDWQQDSCVRGLTQFQDKTVSGGGPIRYWEWQMGNDTSIYAGPNFPYIYKDEVDHTVLLTVVDTSGCRDTVSAFLPYLFLQQLAAFDYTPKVLNSYQKTVTFTDLSINPVKWKWVFGTTGASSLQNPVYEFPDTGMVKVTLYITDARGCRDSVSERLDIVPFVSWFMPNAFTPNDDGINDSFYGKGVLDGVIDFKFSIWNRWGEQIFETNNPETGWNGRKNNTGRLSQNGVYVYLVTFTTPRGEKKEFKGFATIVR
jgi:gliding motility-associated-like protein